MSVMRLRYEMDAYYKEARKTDKVITEINYLTTNMIGPKEAPKLHAKGHETKTLLPFIRALVERHGAVLGDHADPLRSAGDALLQFEQVLASNGMNLPDRALLVPTKQVCA
eukprot:9960904-Alexandrium_andersonii.AAC.1